MGNFARISENFTRWFTTASFLFLAGFAQGATFSVAPSTVSNTYPGYITLSIGGLTNGESVVVQKFIDANTNGVIDAADWLAQQFQLTDGLASVVGGVTNLNVPGDSTPTNGSITAQLNLQTSGIEERFVGKYAFVVSSPAGRFTPVTNLFTVTNAAYAQSFTGTVHSSGTNVPNAVVLTFPGALGQSSPQAGVVANNSGTYTLKTASGTYGLVPFKPGLVTDMAGAPTLTLGAGATITTNLTLLPATRTISGRFVDASNSVVGLPGVLVTAQSTNYLFSLGFTDTNGNFTLAVTASHWELGLDDEELPVTGYLRFQGSLTVDTTTGSVAGVTIPFPKGTALIYGTVTDDQNHPLAGVSFYPDDSNQQYEGDAKTDQNGNYSVAVKAGTWHIQPGDNNPSFANYVFSRANDLPISDGQAVRQDFVAIPAPYHISGYVRDNTNNPIAGVDVWCSGTINGTNYRAFSVYTDATGYYSVNVANGAWTVSPACDDDPGLTQLGFQCVSSQAVNISGGNATANFTVSPCGPLQISTSSPLQGGQIGNYYEIHLQASGCGQFFSFALSPGSQPLPAGLTLYADGTLSGVPGASGTFGFSVRVTDWNNNTSDKSFSLTITGVPLQVTTASLPNGTNGAFYSQPLSATGGQPPYSWSLAPGSASLPPNLSLATNGVISGPITTNGTFCFYVRVTDSWAATSDQSLCVTAINSPLQVTTLVLPKGTVTGRYYTQLGASGGQPPYLWTLPLGSAPLPPSLELVDNGVISGTCTSTGSFPFIVYLSDASLAYVYQPLQIVVNPQPFLGSPVKPATNQFQFEIHGAAGQNYTIQVSSNLVDWNSIRLTNAPADVFTVLLNRSTNRQGFFRVMVGP